MPQVMPQSPKGKALKVHQMMATSKVSQVPQMLRQEMQLVQQMVMAQVP